MPRIDEVAVGAGLPVERVTITQADLVRYAGASGDLNPLHWDPDVASRVSPTGGIIAHGMLSMGHVARVLERWAGGPERLLSMDVSFRSPCPVGETIEISGEVVEIDAQAGTATLAVAVRLADGGRVVDPRRSRAVVALEGS